MTHPEAHVIAAKGVEIYERRYRSEFERQHADEFVAIDIGTEHAYFGEFSEDALTRAKEAAPDGLFYLLRVGSSGAFKLSRISNVARRRV